MCAVVEAQDVRPQSARGANRQRVARHEPYVWSA